MNNVFLSAKWEYLILFNYEVDPAILLPHIPYGTSLDLWQGKALVSLVGFMFNDTRVFGIKWPLYTHFDEVNLRYYVKSGGDDATRGVGFISEIVPRKLIAFIANSLYNEHYRALPMNHSLERRNGEIAIAYRWQFGGRWNTLGVTAADQLTDIQPGSTEEFILEHYKGYSALSATSSVSYRVEHPRWQVFPVKHGTVDADIAGLYGQEFVPFISCIKPHSVLLARGSEILVRKPEYIRAR